MNLNLRRPARRRQERLAILKDAKDAHAPAAATPAPCPYGRSVPHLKRMAQLLGHAAPNAPRGVAGSRIATTEPVTLALFDDAVCISDAVHGRLTLLRGPSAATALEELAHGYLPTLLEQRFPDGVAMAVAADSSGLPYADAFPPAATSSSSRLLVSAAVLRSLFAAAGVAAPARLHDTDVAVSCDAVHGAAAQRGVRTLRPEVRLRSAVEAVLARAAGRPEQSFGAAAATATFRHLEADGWRPVGLHLPPRSVVHAAVSV